MGQKGVHFVFKKYAFDERAHSGYISHTNTMEKKNQ